MSDLVDRLRLMSTDTIGPTAADEIERLRDENAKWKGLADANARVAEACQRRSEKLRITLEVSQAREAQLREAILQVCCDPEGEPCFVGSTGDHDVIRKVLALPTDDTALKARLKAERELCADVAEDVSGGSGAATAIRNLGDE